MKDSIINQNNKNIHHVEEFDFLANKLTRQGKDVEKIITELSNFQCAIPSWALGAGGTRF